MLLYYVYTHKYTHIYIYIHTHTYVIIPSFSHRLHCSSFLGLPYRILEINYKKELQWSLWVYTYQTGYLPGMCLCVRVSVDHQRRQRPHTVWKRGALRLWSSGFRVKGLGCMPTYTYIYIYIYTYLCTIQGLSCLRFARLKGVGA